MSLPRRLRAAERAATPDGRRGVRTLVQWPQPDDDRPNPSDPDATAWAAETAAAGFSPLVVRVEYTDEPRTP